MTSLNDLKKHLNLNVPDAIARGPFEVNGTAVKPLTNIQKKDSTMLTPSQVRAMNDARKVKEAEEFEKLKEEFKAGFRDLFNKHMSDGNERFNSYHARYIAHHGGCTELTVKAVLNELSELGWDVTITPDPGFVLASVGFIVSLPNEEK